MKDDNKKIESIVNELLTPTNMKEYKKVLDKKITDEEDKLIDNWVKFFGYERKVSEVEERLAEAIKKEEDAQIGILKFEDLEEKVDIKKYEYKLEDKKDEDKLETDLLYDIDLSEVTIDDMDIEKRLYFDSLLDRLYLQRDIMASEKIQEELLERFHYFPINVEDIDNFYKENGISLKIPYSDTFCTTYVLKVKDEIIKKFDVILTTNETDDGIILGYQIIEY